MAPVDEIKRRLRAGLRALAGVDPLAAAPAAPQAPSTILDHYVTTAPCPQNALDLFKGEWSSALPEPCAHLRAGPMGLFADTRITWAVEQLGGIDGLSVLELGPLEGGVRPHAVPPGVPGRARVVGVLRGQRRV